MSDKKTVSVNEFKNWLDGVLDFQPEDWTPNAEQWEKIKSKIDQLEETTVVEKVPEPAQPVKGQNQQGAPRQPAQKNPRPEGPLTNIDMDGTVKLPDNAPQRRKHVVTQQQRPPQVIDNGQGGKVVDTGQVHKMEDIDTSDGNYQSSFV